MSRDRPRDNSRTTRAASLASHSTPRRAAGVLPKMSNAMGFWRPFFHYGYQVGRRRHVAVRIKPFGVLVAFPDCGFVPVYRRRAGANLSPFDLSYNPPGILVVEGNF
jgi:hypothetical protein